jgi:hypothetical protein
MVYERNKYYKHFLLTLGSGIDSQVEPNIGSVYRYRGGLHKGRPHLVLGSIHRRRGLGFGSLLQSLFQRAAPLLRTLGTKTVDIVSNIAKDSLQGANIKDSAIKHIQQAVPEAFSGLINREEPVKENFTIINKRKRSAAATRKTVTSNKLRKRSGSGINQLYPALHLIRNGSASSN